MVFGGKFRIRRCNSKASYLPRQSLEKLNSDPDHGSYKLTLTSNEDYVSSAVSAPPSKSSSFDSTTTTTTTILTSGGNKLPHNLPDVLPLGAKLQTQPSSPTAGPPNGGPSPGALRYGSNNNLSTGGNSPTQQHSFPMYPPPTAHRYSTPAMSAYHNIGNSSSGSVTSLASSNSNGSGSGQYPTPPLHYSRSQSYDVNRNPATVSPNGGGGGMPQSGGMHSPSKLMSQSTMDLKRVHSQLEPTLEEGHMAPGDPNSPKVLAPAQSESNLAPKLYPSEDRISEKTTKEGRIFRAECVNTTLVSAVHKAVTRKESLRENIEKITQLQSKLMSAHVGSESGLLMGGNFASTKASPTNTRPLSSSELEKMPHVLEVTESAAVVEEPFQDDDVPDTPPPPPPPLTPPPSLDEDPEESLPATTATDTAAEEAPELPQQISQMDSATDGLKLMQRSEIVLRLNPSTSEVSCQTDDLADCDYNGMAMPQTHKDEAQTRTTLQPRRPHPIELDCDNMSRDLVALLASNDKLIAVLTPQTVKSPTDYVSNLYNPNVPLRPGKRDVGTSTLMRMKSRAGDSKADSGAAVYQFADIEVTLSNGNDEDGDESDGLKKKVDDLIRHINRKIRILNNEQTSIGEESALNDELGSSLVSKLADKVRPIEASKCRTFIDDVGYITSLLLSLSERLARTENSLSGLSNGNSEKKILESKRDRLLEQLEEAKHLKEDIDRRGAVVTSVLEKHLTDEDFADFDYFINMKAKLIADSRDIADKIKCGEEQLNALSEALIQSDC